MGQPKMITVKCKVCKGEFEARVADRKRGWARFCDKSCAATFKARKPNSNWKKYQAMANGFKHFMKANKLSSYEVDEHTGDVQFFDELGEPVAFEVVDSSGGKDY